MNRKDRAELAKETLDILYEGGYTHGENWVSIADSLKQAIKGTQVMTPQMLKELSKPKQKFTGCEIRVERLSTLAAAKEIASEYDVVCLNFASAKNPGGGFLGGSQAQEESLARSSALYACQQLAESYYEANRSCGTTLYTHYMIYSPRVPVFRNDAGNLLEQPYFVNFITAPAVNRGALCRNEPNRVQQADEIMYERMQYLFKLCIHMKQTRLILGAWGCGVFGNQANTIAKLFHRCLTEGGYKNCFELIVFAIPAYGNAQNYDDFVQVLMD